MSSIARIKPAPGNRSRAFCIADFFESDGGRTSRRHILHVPLSVAALLVEQRGLNGYGSRRKWSLDTRHAAHLVHVVLRLISSCPALCRASTSLQCMAKKDVDGRDKPAMTSF
jgi:hypothetical protein